MTRKIIIGSLLFWAVLLLMAAVIMQISLEKARNTPQKEVIAVVKDKKTITYFSKKSNTYSTYTQTTFCYDNATTTRCFEANDMIENIGDSLYITIYPNEPQRYSRPHSQDQRILQTPLLAISYAIGTTLLALVIAFWEKLKALWQPS